MYALMPDEPAYILDIAGLAGDAPSSRADTLRSRRWIGIHFECCGAYTRIYRNLKKTAYVGHCPRCARQVRVAIGPGGSNHRLFRAT